MHVRDDGKYECALCGAQLDMPRGTQPTSTLCGMSGKPNVRVLTVGGKEVHRCTVTLTNLSVTR